MTHHHVYIWQDEKKLVYQAYLYQMSRHALRLKNAMCRIGGCDSDNLCDIFKRMLENVISPLFLKKQHKSNCKKNIKNNFPSNPW